MDGFNGLVSLRNAAPSVPIIVVSANEDADTVREAITYGASGFVPKSLSKDEMVAAVRLVLDGGVYTPRQASRAADRQALCGDAKLAESIAQQVERRVAIKRAIKRAEKVAMDMGVDGIKIRCCGRINNAEISRVEWSKQGKVPLHTLRANIDYGFAEAHTTAGLIGVKVWICKKDDFQPARTNTRRRSNASHA